jgi:hypothetical protein
MAALMTNLGIMERARKLLGAAGRVAGERAAMNRRATGEPNSKHSNGAAQSTTQPIWMETEARVVDCRHEFVRTSELTLRITNDLNKLIVSFTYYAHARTYYDNFISPVARAQGEAFSVYYNALNPRQNILTPSRLLKRGALSDTAVLGFVLLSMLLLTIASG